MRSMREQERWEMRGRRQAENEGRNEDGRAARWRNQGDGDGWLK